MLVELVSDSGLNRKCPGFYTTSNEKQQYHDPSVDPVLPQSFICENNHDTICLFSFEDVKNN